jgi:hypothetical protein
MGSGMVTMVFNIVCSDSLHAYYMPDCGNLCFCKLTHKIDSRIFIIESIPGPWTWPVFSHLLSFIYGPSCPFKRYCGGATTAQTTASNLGGCATTAGTTARLPLGLRSSTAVVPLMSDQLTLWCRHVPPWYCYFFCHFLTEDSNSETNLKLTSRWLEVELISLWWLTRSERER